MRQTGPTLMLDMSMGAGSTAAGQALGRSRCVGLRGICAPH